MNEESRADVSPPAASGLAERLLQTAPAPLLLVRPADDTAQL